MRNSLLWHKNEAGREREREREREIYSREMQERATDDGPVNKKGEREKEKKRKREREGRRDEKIEASAPM